LVVSSERGTDRSNFAYPLKPLTMEQVVECSPYDLSIGSVLAKATPQLGPYRQCTGGGSLRDFLRHGIAPAKRFFESDDAATRPAKRKKGDQSRDFVEVYAEGDWCVPVCLHACVWRATIFCRWRRAPDVYTRTHTPCVTESGARDVT
jgi:hypothetical protein